MRARLAVSVFVLLFSLSLNVAAQDQFPSRVLRASLIEGDVTYLRSDLDKWLDLNINTPILEGDKIWVGRDGRAEIEFEDGSKVRLAQNSVIEFTRLGPYDTSRQVEIQLNKGLATFDVISAEGAFSVATPLFSARVANAANFRVEVDSDDSGRVVVFEGRTEIESRAGSLLLDKGETVSFLSSDPDRYYLGTNYEPDDWDRWNTERDDFLASGRITRPLPYESGWNTAELDQYGSWYSVPTLGIIWHPHCDSSWAPFRTGRWAWYDPFGWTWISYEPWGWLPYHYGRWANVASHGWCWVPGRTHNRWCPGAVNWIEGASWVGWAPLAPSEPWYPYGFNSARPFVSRNLRHGDVVSYLPNEAFLNGTSGGNFSRPRDPLAAGRVVAGQPSLRPTLASRIPVTNAYAGRKFTNEDLEARRDVRDGIIRSTVPAGSLNQASGTVSSQTLHQGNGAINRSAPSSSSGVRVINGGSPVPRQANRESGIRSYNNWNSERDNLHRQQGSQVLQGQPDLKSSDSQGPRAQSPPAGPQSAPVASSTPSETQSRQRVYQIYGSRNEGSVAERHSSGPSSPSRESVGARSSLSAPGPSSGGTSPSSSAAPPARFQPAYNPPPVQRSMPSSAPGSISSQPSSGENGSRGQSHGASSNSSNQGGRSSAQGRANR